MKKKFVSTILIISILSTGLLSGCGKSASAESVDLLPYPWIRLKRKPKKKEPFLLSECRMTGQTGKTVGKAFPILTVWYMTIPTWVPSEELSFESEKDSPTKDIGDVGQAFGPTAIEMDVVQPYKASTWDSRRLGKGPDGKWTISYLGTMGALVNTNNASEPSAWEDLKSMMPKSL